MTTYPGDYANRTTSMAKRLADMVRERGIRRGTLSLKIAMQVDPKIQRGQGLTIAGARFEVT